MSRRSRNLLLGTVAAALLALLIGTYAAWRLAGRAVAEPAEWTAVKRLPRIRPDYSGIVVPPNIAPLNFLVEEPGLEYRVQIHAAAGRRTSAWPRAVRASSFPRCPGGNCWRRTAGAGSNW